MLFCPTSNDSQRVPSWDGVPLDVDVTLPATGDGPFPTIVMMHGWGGTRPASSRPTPEGGGNTTSTTTTSTSPQHGYAVITPSSRGFGRSCGAMDSRTSPGCDAAGCAWPTTATRAATSQYLLGLLVDQDVVNPDEIGVTGISYGGIQSLNLARLRNRIRLPTAPTSAGAARRAPSCRSRRPTRAGAGRT